MNPTNMLPNMKHFISLGNKSMVETLIDQANIPIDGGEYL